MDRQRRPARVAVRAIIQRPPGHYLIVNAAPDADDPWDFPGDEVQAPRSAEDALRQSLRVRLGIEPAELTPQVSVSWGAGSHAVRVHFYAGTLPQDTVVPLGYACVRWVTVDQLGEYAFAGPSAMMVDRLRAPDSGLHSNS